MKKHPKVMKMLSFKKQVQTWKARYEKLNQWEIKETRKASYETKLRQFFLLMEWADFLGWKPFLEKDVEKVRSRWVRLKKAYREGKTKKK